MLKINKAYKFRIYPNEKQKLLIEKHFGASRFIWNYFLNQRKEYYLKTKESKIEQEIKGNLNYYDNAKELTLLKKKEEYKWLKEINSQSSQATLKYLDDAFRKFFNKKANFPRFKAKHNSNQSFTIPQHIKLKSEDKKIQIPKFKEGIKIKEHRKLKGKIVNATISRSHTNKYFISIITEQEIEETLKLENKVGIDLGVKDFLVCSNGEKFSNPKFLKKYEKKLKFNQRQLCKKKKQSNNRIKAKLKVAKIHEKIKNSRKDFQHKISSKLINENQVIILEDLNIKGMIQNRKLSKAISDSSWSNFLTLLTYKANWKEREIIKIDRFFPSSKTCHECNFINQDLLLSDRNWICPSCNTNLDRDLNASKNILAQGLLKLSSTKEEQNKAVGTTV